MIMYAGHLVLCFMLVEKECVSQASSLITFLLSFKPGTLQLNLTKIFN